MDGCKGRRKGKGREERKEGVQEGEEKKTTYDLTSAEEGIKAENR